MKTFSIACACMLVTHLGVCQISSELFSSKTLSTGTNPSQQSSEAYWEAAATAYLRASEYHFTTTTKGYLAINRAQKLMHLVEGKTVTTKFLPASSSDNSWEYRSSLSSIGRGANPSQNFIARKIHSGANELEFQCSNFAIQYINNEKGLRQNFVVNSRPAGSGRLQAVLATSGTLEPAVESSARLVLKDKSSGKIQLFYDDLKVWDANHKLLPASMHLNNAAELVIAVDDQNAVYPITIDPLTHSPEWITSADAVLPSLLTNLQLQVDAIYGYSVSALGDVNGDGFDDVAIGAPGAIDIIAGPTIVAGAGAVFVYYGSSAGLPVVPSKILRATTPLANALFGFSVAAGNLYGDSRNDIVIGAPGETYTANVGGIPSTALVTAGRTYIFRGEDLTPAGNPAPFASVYLNGSGFFSNGVAGILSANVSIKALFGFSVAVTGDMNGDGLGELIVGAPGYAAPGLAPLLPVRTGAAVVYYSSAIAGNTAVKLMAPSASLLGIPLITDGLLFGFSVDGAGDYNKDGRPDLVIGAPGGITLDVPTNLLGGSAYVFTGTGSGINTTHFAHLRATPSLVNNAANLFGYSVRGATTANGSRNGNIIIGAPAENVLSYVANGLKLKSGSVHVFKGTNTPNASGELPAQVIKSPRANHLLSILGGNNVDIVGLFGASIDNMLDVNCDGINDIIVGEPLSTAVGIVNANAIGGAAHIFLGKADGTFLPGSFWSLTNNTDFPIGINAGSMLGYSVAGAKHVRGSGRGVRALIGAPGAMLDFSSGLLNLGGTVGTLYSFVAINNGVGKAYGVAFDECGLMINPDVNVTWVNTPVPGDVKTNDVVPAESTYGVPQPRLANPGVGSIAMNTDGTYTFTGFAAGEYYYDVPVCLPGGTLPCYSSELKITVLDKASMSRPPVANTDIATTRMNTPVAVNSLANDKCSNTGCMLNPASVTIVRAALNGSVTVNTANGVITYTPNASFAGKDTLWYSVCDAGSPVACATAMQVITVYDIAAVNTTSAADDYFFTAQGSLVSGNVKLNDTDAEGHSQTVQPQVDYRVGIGTFDLSASGDFTFSPEGNFTGPVSFAYTICDGGNPAACASATVYIMVNSLTALPLRLITFDARKKACDVSLSWSLSEQANSVVIEKSEDGILFGALAVPGIGGAVLQNQVSLQQPKAKAFYRLKITAKSGDIFYSETRLVETQCGETEVLTVQPSVTTGTTHVIYHNTELKGAAVIMVTDVYGRTMLQQNVYLSQGSSQASIDCSSLPAGFYYVTIANKVWRSETVKIVKK